MTHAHDENYCDIPLSPETPRADISTYWRMDELAKKCESCKGHVLNCRTIGILQSNHGKFFLTELEAPCQEPCVRVSMVYLPSPPQSTVVPYPVQVFGWLLWKNRPVIFAMILQVLNISKAIKLQKTMSASTKLHLAMDTRLYDPGPEMLDEESDDEKGQESMMLDEESIKSDEKGQEPIQNGQIADLSVTLLNGAFPR